MKSFCAFKFVIVIAAIATFTSCKDYLDNTNVETGNGRIGLPGNVNIINTANGNSKSRAVNLIPDIHTSTTVGGNNPLFLRYTTTPGIVTNSNVKNITASSTRSISITTNNFYDSYSLYSYVYSGYSTWSAKISGSNVTFPESYLDEQVEKGKGWVTDQFWPGDREKCAFFAYAPYHAKGLSKFTINTWPSFHYSVPLDVVEQNDLLVTRNVIPANTSAYGNIDISGDFNKPDSLTFDHACTAIRFAIGDQMAPGVITKIKINNVYGAGDYSYETESWSNVDSLKSFTLTQNFEIKPGEHNKILNNDDNVFMMVPQIVPEDATIEVTVNDGTERTIRAYIQRDDWKKGYTVTYYLSTAKVDGTYVLSIAPASGNIACTGGTKAVTIRSYKQTYYGSQVAVPWTASYTYDDADQVGTINYNEPTNIVTGFTASGKGSTVGESVNFQVASQVARSKSWRSNHTQTLRNAPDGSCDLAAGKQTANCYVIQAPGTYTFPLVYGNALNADKNPNNDSYGTASFVDHNGVQINSPYIYATNGGANVPYDACVVWQDAPHLVTPSSVQLTSDKHSIQFTVERKNICAGNCVIAVRDKNKNIMWSWHIWVTDHSMTHTYEVHNTTSSGGNVVSNFMEVPLGFCDDEVRVYDPRTFHLTLKQKEVGGQTASVIMLQLTSDSTYTYGVNAPYYQWGRKDPFLPSNGMGDVDKPYYDNSYALIYNSAQTSTNGGIIFPYSMFGYSNWNSSFSKELWNKGNSLYSLNNNVVNKTIYDPNPVGFVMPKPAAFTGFGLGGGNSVSPNIYGTFNNGYYFYTTGWKTGSTVFFNSLGERYTSGLSRSKTLILYPTSGPANSVSAYALWINGGSVYCYCYDNDSSYSIGMSIRPTSE